MTRECAVQSYWESSCVFGSGRQARQLRVWLRSRGAAARRRELICCFWRRRSRGARAVYSPVVRSPLEMSGGSPVAGSGCMRKRHSQGCFDDLEDDGVSRIPHLSVAVTYRAQTWTHVLENFLWITSAVFMIYLGDSHRNLFSVLCRDNRIRRCPLFLGLLSSLANLAMILCGAVFIRNPQKYPEKCTILPSYAPLVAVLGLLSFILFSFALWPIWKFLTIPLLFTLLMAMMVISPYLPLGPLRQQSSIVGTV